MEGLSGGHHVERAEELAALKEARQKVRRETTPGAESPATVKIDVEAQVSEDERVTDDMGQVTVELRREEGEVSELSGAEGTILEHLPLVNVESIDVESHESVQALVDALPLEVQSQLNQLLGKGAFGTAFALLEKHTGWKRAMFGPYGGPSVLKLVRALPEHLGKPNSETMQIFEEGGGDVLPDAEASLEQVREFQEMIADEVEATRAGGLLNAATRVKDASGEEYVAITLKYVPEMELTQFLKETQEHKTPEEVHGYRGTVAVAFEALAQQADELHRQGWVHKDLKPGNVRLDKTVPSRTRGIDFGIARRISQGPEKGVVRGTPGFMLPELLANRDHDIRQEDLYPLGVMLGLSLRVLAFPDGSNESATPKTEVGTEGKIDRDASTEAGDLSPKEQREALMLQQQQEMMMSQILGTWLQAPERDKIQEWVTERTGVPLSPKELELAELSWDMTQPHADAFNGERQKAYADYDGGAGMTMDRVVRRFDTILPGLNKEHPIPHFRGGEIEEMRMEVEADIRRDALRDVEAARRLFADNTDDERVAEQMVQVEEAYRAANDRHGYEYASILAQDARAMMGETPNIEPPDEIELAAIDKELAA